jgi:putative ABC transport system permease protein
VIREGMTLALVGMILGIPASLASSRAMARFQAGIGGTTPSTLVGVAILLATVMLLACWIPARRAAMVDPIDALRCE